MAWAWTGQTEKESFTVTEYECNVSTIENELQLAVNWQ